SGIGAGGGQIFAGDFTEERIRRRRRVGSERRKADHAPGLRRGAAQRYVLEGAAYILAARHGQRRAGENRGNHPRLNWFAVDLLANEPLKNERSLGMRDEDEAAALIVMLEIIFPRIQNVVILQPAIERASSAAKQLPQPG